VLGDDRQALGFHEAGHRIPLRDCEVAKGGARASSRSGNRPTL
jgi:hypothetical protein